MAIYRQPPQPRLRARSDAWLLATPQEANTAVSNSAVCGYAVRRFLSTGAGGSCSIGPNKRITKSSIYALAVSASIDANGGYLLQGVVTSTFAGAYAVPWYVYNEVPASYGTRATISVDGPPCSYALAGSTELAVSSGYVVLASAANSSSATYLLNAEATTLFTAAYVTGGSTAANVTAGYGIQGAISATNPSSYSVQGGVVTGAALAYYLTSAISCAASANYTVVGSAQANELASYVIAASAFRVLAVDYKVQQTASKDSPGSYQVLVRGEVIRTFIGSYSVDGNFLPSTYNIYVPLTVNKATAPVVANQAYVPVAKHDAYVPLSTNKAYRL